MMPISVDWPTAVITVPLADLTLLSGNRYTFDVLQFHLDLRTIHAMEAGGIYPKTHDHNQNVVLAGIDYADTVEILPPYTVEFEDGQRQVVLTGANHNLSDRQVVNSVGLITQNSAGLIRAGMTSTQEALLAQVAALLGEIHRIEGLDSANPRTTSTVSPTQETITAGDITIDVVESGDDLTATRQP